MTARPARSPADSIGSIALSSYSSPSRSVAGVVVNVAVGYEGVGDTTGVAFFLERFENGKLLTQCFIESAQCGYSPSTDCAAPRFGRVVAKPVGEFNRLIGHGNSFSRVVLEERRGKVCERGQPIGVRRGSLNQPVAGSPPGCPSPMISATIGVSLTG